MPSDMDLLVATLGGVIGGGIIGVAASELIRWWRRPKIELSVGLESPYACNTTITQKILAEREETRWLRLGIENKGRLVAHGCRVFLVEIELLQAGGAPAFDMQLTNPLELNWAGTQDTKRDLPVGIEMFLDVLRVSKSQNFPLTCFNTIDHEAQEIFSVATSENVALARLHFVATANEIQSTKYYADVDCRLADADNEMSENHWKRFNWK